MEKFDLVVIGAGPGGYPAAIRAAQLGASVALVEKEMLGGTCLNWGCIPSKTLIAAAELFDQVQHAADFGITTGKPGFDYATLAQRKQGVVTQLRNGVAQLLKSHGVRVFQGTGAFEGRNRIRVTRGAEADTIETAATIIATGSTSALPSFLPSHPAIMESRRFLDLTALPASLIVMGGGVIGCEFACMAAHLGVKVTIVELLEDILLVIDADLRRELRRHMESRLGIKILTGRPLTDVAAGAKGVTGRCGDEALAAAALLVAVGRRPVTDELNLAQAGLRTTKAGHIEVDAWGRTAVATIYAIGDVIGGVQLAHKATAQGTTVAENIVRRTHRRLDTVVPNCIFTTPEIGTVGLSEQDAKAQQHEVQIGKFTFAHLGKALAIGRTEGYVKWIADAKTGQLLGAAAIGPHATELIAEATLAVRGEFTAAEIGHVIHCHPTLAEPWMEAAQALQGLCVHAPPKK